MRMQQSRGVKTSNWSANELVTNQDMLQNGYDRYRNSVDLLSNLADPYSNDGSVSVILSGLNLVWSSGRTFVLQGGMAVGYGGSYLDDTGTFGFVASAGMPFVVVADNDNVPISAGAAGSDRYDTVEIRPVRTEYDVQNRDFRDPLTGVVGGVPIATKIEYGWEVAVLEGTPGGSAPSATAGWIKLAEVFVPDSVTVLDQGSVVGEDGSNNWVTEARASISVESILKPSRRSEVLGWNSDYSAEYAGAAVTTACGLLSVNRRRSGVMDSASLGGGTVVQGSVTVEGADGSVLFVAHPLNGAHRLTVDPTTGALTSDTLSAPALSVAVRDVQWWNSTTLATYGIYSTSGGDSAYLRLGSTTTALPAGTSGIAAGDIAFLTSTLVLVKYYNSTLNRFEIMAATISGEVPTFGTLFASVASTTSGGMCRLTDTVFMDRGANVVGLCSVSGNTISEIDTVAAANSTVLCRDRVDSRRAIGVATGGLSYIVYESDAGYTAITADPVTFASCGMPGVVSVTGLSLYPDPTGGGNTLFATLHQDSLTESSFVITGYVDPTTIRLVPCSKHIIPWSTVFNSSVIRIINPREVAIGYSLVGSITTYRFLRMPIGEFAGVSRDAVAIGGSEVSIALSEVVVVPPELQESDFVPGYPVWLTNLGYSTKLPYGDGDIGVGLFDLRVGTAVSINAFSIGSRL